MKKLKHIAIMLLLVVMCAACALLVYLRVAKADVFVRCAKSEECKRCFANELDAKADAVFSGDSGNHIAHFLASGMKCGEYIRKHEPSGMAPVDAYPPTAGTQIYIFLGKEGQR